MTSRETTEEQRGTPEAAGAEVAGEARGKVEELSYLDLLNILLRYRRLLIGLPLLSMIVFVSIALFSARVYTATASLLPTSYQGGASRLSGFAAQLGINVDAGDPGQSSAFYGTLLETREILEPTVLTQYSFRSRADSISGSLIQLLEAKGQTPGEKLESALLDLDDRISVDVDRQTGLVQFKVRTPWAALSYAVAERIISLVSEFNVERMQSQARAEQAFAEQLVERARTALRQAENNLQVFLQRNRLYESDPQLVFEHDRLQRAVNMSQDVYTSLSQSLEQARIDAARNTPPITVVEHPHIPARPDSRGVLKRALLGFIIGALIGIVFAVLHDFMVRSQKLSSRSSQQYAALRAATIGDLRRLFRLRKN